MNRHTMRKNGHRYPTTAQGAELLRERPFATPTIAVRSRNYTRKVPLLAPEAGAVTVRPELFDKRLHHRRTSLNSFAYRTHR